MEKMKKLNIKSALLKLYFFERYTENSLSSDDSTLVQEVIPVEKGTRKLEQKVPLTGKKEDFYPEDELLFDKKNLPSKYLRSSSAKTAEFFNQKRSINIRHPPFNLKPNQTRNRVDSEALTRLKPRRIAMDKERLYEENMALKLKNNSLLQEILKLRTKVSQIERELVKREDQTDSSQFSKPVHMINNLKITVKELKGEIFVKDEEINRLKKNIKSTKLNEIELEVQAYIDECTRLRHHLEEIMRQRNTPTAGQGIAEDRSTQHTLLKDNLMKENQDLNQALDQASGEIAKLKGKIKELEKEKKKNVVKKNGLVQLKGENSKLKGRLNQFVQEIAEKEGNFKEEILKVKRNLNDAYGKVNNYEGKIKNLICEIEEKDKKIKSFQERNKKENSRNKENEGVSRENKEKDEENRNRGDFKEKKNEEKKISRDFGKDKGIIEEEIKGKEEKPIVQERLKNEEDNHAKVNEKQITEKIQENKSPGIEKIKYDKNKSPDIEITKNEEEAQDYSKSSHFKNNEYEENLFTQENKQDKHEDFENNFDEDLSENLLNSTEPPKKPQEDTQNPDSKFEPFHPSDLHKNSPDFQAEKKKKPKKNPKNLEKNAETLLKHLSFRMQINRIPKNKLSSLLFKSSEKPISKADLFAVFQSSPLNFSAEESEVLSSFLIESSKSSAKLIEEKLLNLTENWEIFNPEEEEKFDDLIAETVFTKKDALLDLCKKLDKKQESQIPLKSFKKLLSQLSIKFPEKVMKYMQLLFYSHSLKLDLVPYENFINAYLEQGEEASDEEKAEIAKHYLGIIARVLFQHKITVFEVFECDENGIIGPNEFFAGLQKMGLEEIEEDHVMVLLEALQFDQAEDVCIHIEELEEIMGNFLGNNEGQKKASVLDSGNYELSEDSPEKTLRKESDKGISDSSPFTKHKSGEDMDDDEFN